MRLLNTWSVAVILFSMLSSLGCTRGSDSQSLKLTFNSSSSNSAQSITGKLDFAVINVQLPSGPLVKEFEFRDNPIPAGQQITMEVPNVPKGSFLVQFLGIYKDDGIAGQFVYGDAMAVPSGQNMEANIQATKIGSFATEGHVSGRYLTQTGPENGPTGTLSMQFQPPGNKPKMNIHPFKIVDGWFSIMALDGAPMDYMLSSTKEVLFKQVKLSSGNLIIDGTAIPTGNHLAHFKAPATFRYEDGDNNSTTVEARAPADMYFGFFQKTGLGLALSSTKKVCYANGVQEAIPGYYLTNVGGTLSNPVEFNSSTPGANDIQRVSAGGGLAQTLTGLYTDPATECSVASPQDRMVLYHNMLGTGDEKRMAGISAPFVAINPFSIENQFLSATYSASSLNLSWRVLPGLTSISGYTIFSKYSQGGDGGGGGDRSCEDLRNEGYSEAGNVVGAANTTYSFSNGNLNNNTKYNWRFAVCAYQSVNGEKNFVGNFIQGGSIGGSMDSIHTGWAGANKVYTGVTSENYTATMLGAVLRVIGVDASNDFYTQLGLSGGPLAPAQAGDEVMLSVVGMNGTDPCGFVNGESVGPGRYGFARILETSPNLRISKGSFIDQLSGNADIGSAPGSSPMCYIQVTKVLQYRTLDLSATTSLTAPNFTNYASPGGAIPIRVNGTLTIGSTTNIDVTGSGFAGGASINSHGAGAGGPSNSTTPPLLGGQGSSSPLAAAGGAGTGSGGRGSFALDTSGINSGGNMGLLFGGGGGLGGGGANGGSGGGLIFINAHVTQVSGSPLISANGLGGASSTGFGGGGAGGSVLFMTGNLSGVGTLNVQAKGGSGGNASAGVGGGGWVTATACSAPSATIVGNADQGVTGITSATGQGSVDTTGSNNQYLCRMLH